jgi:choline dehydrogenase-like flavoprotein
MVTAQRLIAGLDQLAQHQLNVLIIGSGPAGVAVAERLYEKDTDLQIGILERGETVTLTHLNNIFPNKMRRALIDKYKANLWEGHFKEGGMLLPALGGRGIASGAHLRRFDEVDFKLWPNAQWPESVIKQLPQLLQLCGAKSASEHYGDSRPGPDLGGRNSSFVWSIPPSHRSRPLVGWWLQCWTRL